MKRPPRCRQCGRPERRSPQMIGLLVLLCLFAALGLVFVLLEGMAYFS